MLDLVKAFLKAGVLTEGGGREDAHTGTPQGGILAPPTRWRTCSGPMRTFLMRRRRIRCCSLAVS
jgi:hypothetical protein